MYMFIYMLIMIYIVLYIYDSVFSLMASCMLVEQKRGHLGPHAVDGIPELIARAPMSPTSRGVGATHILMYIHIYVHFTYPYFTYNMLYISNIKGYRGYYSGYSSYCRFVSYQNCHRSDISWIRRHASSFGKLGT